VRPSGAPGRATPRGEPDSAFGVIIVVFLACLLLESAAPGDQRARYAKYLLPWIAFGITAPLAPPAAPSTFARRTLRRFLVLASVGVAASVAVGLLRHAPSGRALDEAYLVLAPLVTAYLIFPSLRVERIPIYADWLFLGTIAAYLIERGGAIASFVSDLGGVWHQLLTSTSPTESGAAFVFGLFTLYYLLTGRRRRASCAALFMLLGFKRIAMLATLMCALLWVLLPAMRAEPPRRWRTIAFVALLVNAIILVGLYQLSIGGLDEIISAQTGMSSEWFTMGRESLYAELFRTFDITWSGSGLGTTMSHFMATHGELENAHSDVIKYTIEAGPLVAAAWLWGFYRLARGAAAALLLAVYTNILFVTDNVSIYFWFMFVFYVLVGLASVRAEQRLGRELTRTRRGRSGCARPPAG